MRKIAQSSATARERIVHRQVFETYGNMSGVTSWYTAGHLSGRAREAWLADRYNADYVVLSYGTPIAWHVPGAGWTYVDRHFSPSTAKTQAQVRYALHAAGIEYRELQTRHHLSDAMVSMLYWADRGATQIKGAQWRTARALEAKGLGVLTDDGHFLINDNGRDY